MITPIGGSCAAAALSVDLGDGAGAALEMPLTCADGWPRPTGWLALQPSRAAYNITLTITSTCGVCYTWNAQAKIAEVYAVVAAGVPPPAPPPPPTPPPSPPGGVAPIAPLVVRAASSGAGPAWGHQYIVDGQFFTGGNAGFTIPGDKFGAWFQVCIANASAASPVVVGVRLASRWDAVVLGVSFDNDAPPPQVR